MNFELNINGQKRQVEADPEMPLLWLLRDVLNMTGTKYGCGKGLCGSCMVLIDEQAVNSCLIAVGSIEDTSIFTIEGESENLQLLQKSWSELNVPQCGFCQPGQLITATALLNSNQSPSEEDVEMAMSRNICRCGTYQRIKKAIERSVEVKMKDES